MSGSDTTSLLIKDPGKLISESDAVKLSAKMLNELILECKIEFPRVWFMTNVEPSIYLLIFEKIFGYKIPDLIEPQNDIDQAHNIQCLIDTLSLDILSISLSHITGEAVAAREALATYNLLRVFKSYLNLTRMNLKGDSVSSFPATKLSKTLEKSSSASEVSLEFSTTNSTEESKVKDLDQKKSDKTSFSRFCSSKENRSEELSSICVSFKGEVCSTTSTSHETQSILKHLKDDTTQCSSGIFTITSKSVSDLTCPEHSKPGRKPGSPKTITSVLLPKYKTGHRLTPLTTRRTNVTQSCRSQGALTELNKHLPHVEISSQTKNMIRNSHSNQIRLLTNRVIEMQTKNTRTKRLQEEQLDRQIKKIKMDKEDIETEKRLSIQKGIRQSKANIQKAIRESKAQKARSRRYFKQFQMDHQNKMTQPLLKEEKLFKDLYQERLKLQKDLLHQVNKDFRQLDQDVKTELDHRVQSQSNLYENKISFVKEKVRKMQKDIHNTAKSKELELENFKKDLRLQLEKEVEDIQHHLHDKSKDFHFRETDAERFRRNF